MTEPFIPQNTPKGTFYASTIIVVVVGVTIALGVCLALKGPAQVVVEKEVVKYKEKPAPQPQVIYREVERTPPPVQQFIQQPPPPPPPATWEGVWNKKGLAFPTVQLQQRGNAVRGRLVTDWNKILDFQGGVVLGDVVEFAVNDQLFRTHFRMTLTKTDEATVEHWVTDPDWIESLRRANMAARNPLEAALLRQQLEDNRKNLNEAKLVGTFTRRPQEKGLIP
jgi:hypothetical protein